MNHQFTYTRTRFLHRHGRRNRLLQTSPSYKSSSSLAKIECRIQTKSIPVNMSMNMNMHQSLNRIQMSHNLNGNHTMMMARAFFSTNHSNHSRLRAMRKGKGQNDGHATSPDYRLRTSSVSDNGNGSGNSSGSVETSEMTSSSRIASKWGKASFEDEDERKRLFFSTLENRENDNVSGNGNGNGTRNSKKKFVSFFDEVDAKMKMETGSSSRNTKRESKRSSSLDDIFETLQNNQNKKNPSKSTSFSAQISKKNNEDDNVGGGGDSFSHYGMGINSSESTSESELPKTIFDSFQRKKVDERPNAYEKEEFNDYLDAIEIVVSRDRFLRKHTKRPIEDNVIKPVIDWLLKDERVVPFDFPSLKEAAKNGISMSMSDGDGDGDGDDDDDDDDDDKKHKRLKYTSLGNLMFILQFGGPTEGQVRHIDNMVPNVQICLYMSVDCPSTIVYATEGVPITSGNELIKYWDEEHTHEQRKHECDGGDDHAVNSDQINSNSRHLSVPPLVKEILQKDGNKKLKKKWYTRYFDFWGSINSHLRCFGKLYQPVSLQLGFRQTDPGTTLLAGGNEIHAGPPTTGPRMFAFAIGIPDEEDDNDVDVHDIDSKIEKESGFVENDDEVDQNDGEVQYSPVLLHIDFCCLLFAILDVEYGKSRSMESTIRDAKAFLLHILLELLVDYPMMGYLRQIDEGERPEVHKWLGLVLKEILVLNTKDASRGRVEENGVICGLLEEAVESDTTFYSPDVKKRRLKKKKKRR